MGEIDMLRSALSERSEPATPDSQRSESAMYEDEEVHDIVVFKHAQNCPLGLRFRDPLSDYGYQLRTPDGAVRAIVEHLVDDSIASKVLQIGDEVVSINGEPIGGPSEAAATLRELDGYVTLGVVHDAMPASQLGTPASAYSASSPGGFSQGSRECYLSDDDDEAPAEDSSSGDDERFATGAAAKKFAPSVRAIRGDGPVRPMQPMAGAPPRPVAGAPFKLELPPTSFHDVSPAVTGAKGHLRLSAKGSGKRLLRKSAAPGNADGSLTARVRALGALLSPRA